MDLLLTVDHNVEERDCFQIQNAVIFVKVHSGKAILQLFGITVNGSGYGMKRGSPVCLYRAIAV